VKSPGLSGSGVGGGVGGPSDGGASLDVGQSVELDSWVNKKDGLARVRYRNALWDAKILDEQAPEVGSFLYIRNVEGNTLHVSKNPAA
jgi:membrane protein implicated in regulation of membrane protease activity